MITSKINAGDFNIKINYKSISLSHKGPDTYKKNPVNAVNDTDTSINNVQELENIFNIKSTLNNIARHIRTANNTLNKMNNLIEKSKDNLQEIIKNFPPFPPGNEERVKRLKSITALKKQINELTIPAPEKEIWDILPEKNKTVPNSGSDMINRYAGSFNLSEINITYLDENATNEQIISSINELEVTGEKINQKKTGLKLYLTVTLNSALNIFIKNGENTTNQDVSDNKAKTMSIETKSLLLAAPKINLINDHTLLEM